jgi:transposase
MSFEELFSDYQDLKSQLAALSAKSQQQEEIAKHYESENSRLHEIIRELKRLKFGTKSERWETEEQLVLLFNEAEVEAAKPDEDSADQDEEVEVQGYKKKRGHRKALPTELPREVVEITLPPEELFSSDGLPLKPIGKEISEKLVYEPGQVKVIEYHRTKYGIDSGDYVKTAPPVPSLIPKGIATPELLAHIALQKYGYGMPLYRQEEKFKHEGIELPRSTMARWMVQVAQACMPIRNVLADRLFESFYVSCDETRIQVLKEKGRRAESQSWMWVRSTPYGQKRIVLFDYNPSRSGEVVEQLFAEYQGYLQVDGYSGYNPVKKNKEIIEIGCNMHGRRYFEKALVVGAKAGKTLAEVGMKFYEKLFDLEKEIRQNPPDERYRLRLQLAVPIWTEFKAWVDKNYDKVPPKTKIGAAFHYFREQYVYLIGYLKDGRLEIDNGFVERAIRKFAIGRNNWMFSDTEAGAEASALLYSLLVTMKINNVNPYKALKTLFTELPKAKTLEDYERLADLIVTAPASL